MRLLVRLSVLVLLLAVGGVVALPGAPMCAEKKETPKEAPKASPPPAAASGATTPSP